MKNLSHTVASTQTDVDHAMAEIAQIRSDFNRFAVANQALWDIVSSRLNVTEAELLAAVEAVEERLHKGAPLCPHCHRPVNLHHKICLYCEKEIERSVFAT